MQKAQKEVRQTVQDVGGTLKLLGQLKEGMTSEDVKLLQTILAADTEVYPEGLITGFYGRLTAKAVKNFQKKHGFEQAGNVGPKTLKKLNEALDENPVSTQANTSGKKEHCAIVPPGHLIAPGWLKKQGDIKPIVPICQVLPSGIAKKLATTTPPIPVSDTTPPVISSVAGSGIASTTATVGWTTNEQSSSKVYFGTTTPLSLSTAGFFTNSALVTTHSLGLVGLTASTTCYFVAESKDAANNTATSSEQSFTTLP